MSEQTRAAVLIAGIAAPALAAALTWGAVLPPAKAAIEAPEQASTSDEGHAESQASEQAPESTLQRMTEAQRVVEYEGTLVYLHGAQLSTLRIAHRIDNGRSKESLFALSGPIRAVARNDRGVTCMLSGEHSFSVPRGQQGGGLLRAAPREFERIRQHYLLHALGQSRVAGRDTDVVGIVPLDHYRYGYRFFVDRATGLPLKIDLMGDTAEPIEQVMFTSVDIIGTNTDVEAETPVEPQASPLADSATILAPIQRAGGLRPCLPASRSWRERGRPAMPRGQENHRVLWPNPSTRRCLRGSCGSGRVIRLAASEARWRPRCWSTWS